MLYCMKDLDYGIRFEFTQDYITKTRYYQKGVRCNILNGIVVLDSDGDFLFDVNSPLAKKYGKLVDNNSLYENIRKYTDLELEKFMEEFYSWAYTDGHNGNEQDYKKTWEFATKEFEYGK